MPFNLEGGVGVGRCFWHCVVLILHVVVVVVFRTKSEMAARGTDEEEGRKAELGERPANQLRTLLSCRHYVMRRKLVENRVGFLPPTSQRIRAARARGKPEIPLDVGGLGRCDVRKIDDQSLVTDGR